VTLLERVLTAETALNWIRDCLDLKPGIAHLTVSGTCMEPALRSGAKVTLRRVSGRPRVGDVVLLRTAWGLRLHRVVLRLRGTLRTKGDQGMYLDPPASDGDVLAVWEGDESRWASSVQAGLSLIRLLKRPWTSSSTGDAQGDAAHRGSLP
jgi:hypothetical protein